MVKFWRRRIVWVCVWCCWFELYYNSVANWVEQRSRSFARVSVTVSSHDCYSQSSSPTLRSSQTRLISCKISSVSWSSTKASLLLKCFNSYLVFTLVIVTFVVVCIIKKQSKWQMVPELVLNNQWANRRVVSWFEMPNSCQQIYWAPSGHLFWSCHKEMHSRLVFLADVPPLWSNTSFQKLVDHTH